MSIDIAILSPTNLLGTELREALDRNRPDWLARLSLLASDEEEVGVLTETAGRAAMVARAEPAALEGVDLVFACGDPATELALLAERPAGATAVVLSPSATAEAGTPVVDGVNLDAAEAGSLLVSPHPAAVALSLLLAPLAPLGVAGVAATVVLPVSVDGPPEALDELFDQTRSVMAMAGQGESMFGRQLAFNLYPEPPRGPEPLARLVRRTTGLDAPMAVHAVRGAIFHGITLSAFVEVDRNDGGDIDEARILDALDAHPLVEVLGEDDHEPSPIDAANRDELLVGAVRPAPERPGGFWIWAVMDNLTRGGALNALAIAEQVV